MSTTRGVLRREGILLVVCVYALAHSGCAAAFSGVMEVDHHRAQALEHHEEFVSRWESAVGPQQFAEYARAADFGDKGFLQCARRSNDENILLQVAWSAAKTLGDYRSADAREIQSFLHEFSSRMRVELPARFEGSVLLNCCDTTSKSVQRLLSGRLRRIGMPFEVRDGRMEVLPRKRRTTLINERYQDIDGYTLSLSTTDDWKVLATQDSVLLANDGNRVNIARDVLESFWPQDREPLCEVCVDGESIYVLLAQSDGCTSKLGCIDKRSGEIRWINDLWAWEGSTYCLKGHPPVDVFVTTTSDDVFVFMDWSGSFNIDRFEKSSGRRTLSFSTAHWGY